MENTATLSTFFSTYGWYTVPLSGTLYRDENGKKNSPIFSRNWRTIYSEHLNDLDANLGGVITGKKSNITVLDCDNDTTYELFRALDPDYDMVFHSIGKQGATIVYLYEADLEDMRIHGDTLSLDLLNDSGFAYLPTKHNYTKNFAYFNQTDILPEVKVMPQLVKATLLALQQVKSSSAVPFTSNGAVSNLRLAPAIERAIKSKEYNPQLFSVLTPVKYRGTKYTKSNGRHPNTIPDGEGNNYLLAIATKLAVDVSVSTGLFVDTLNYINNLWDSPMPNDRLMKTIINPHISGASGFFTYDPEWDKNTSVFTTLTNDMLEVFTDPYTSEYFIVNHTSSVIHRERALPQALEILRKYLGSGISKDALTDSPRLRTTISPLLPYGHNGDTFNLFEQTEALSILRDPSVWDSEYKRPEAFISFMEHLIPDDTVREYLLRFLLTKLTTFDYSPVTPYLIGVQGAGKDTLMAVLRNILGHSRVESITGTTFIDKWNSWLEYAIFTQVNEMSNNIESRNKPKALAYLKYYTGSPEVTIEKKGINPYTTRIYNTLILTDNSDPLNLEANDRRILYVNTPNKMTTNPLLLELYNNDIGKFYSDVTRDVNNICYYLATAFTKLSSREYTTPLASNNKHEAIESNLPYAKRLAYMLLNGRVQALWDWLYEARVQSVVPLFADVEDSTGISETALFNCYLELKPDADISVLKHELKASKLLSYTKEKLGLKTRYYTVPALVGFTVPTTVVPNKVQAIVADID